MFELWKYRETEDKKDFYLYLYDIRYEQYVFPLFYIPVSVERGETGDFALEFDPVLLANKKAIQYVTERYAKAHGKDWRFSLPRRHLYLNSYGETRCSKAHRHR
jgi:hypothetical protein